MVKSMVLRELHTLEETTMDKVRFLMSDTGAQITAACREALEQKGVEVTVVEKDGNKVLQKMLSVRPQVVLLDAFMPGLDALAVKQRYNAAGERHTSFFVTGAFQSEEMLQELLSMLTLSQEAFEKESSEIASRIFLKDNLIDEINHNSTRIIADYIEKHPGSALVGLYMAGVIRKMERFGDHCTNIAEELIFYLDAKVMKHIGKTEN